MVDRIKGLPAPGLPTTFTYESYIYPPSQLGFNTAVFGGVAVFTACHFQEQNIAAVYTGVGQAFIVRGKKTLCLKLQ